MKAAKLVEIAKDIIKNNIYLTLSTTDGKKPWATPLYYCADNKYNFYFISQMDSLHTKNILKDPKVAFAIFDSHQKEGTGNGVQASGKAYLLKKEKEIAEALRWFHTNFIEIKKEKVLGNSKYKLFKITPEHFYVLDPEAKVDKRVEVKLR